MTDADFDDIELSIHREAWEKVERILDKRRRKLHRRAMVAADGRLTVQFPADVPPGEYQITLLIEERTT